MKFSVAIPAYKKDYLKECITSILAQTYTDFELVVVNDASPYDLDSIINYFNDSRIHYYKNTRNCGAINVVDNWNICLNYAQGDYIVLMGDDDMMMPNYLQEFAELIQKYPNLGVYHCRSFIINEYSKKVDITPSWPEFETVYENIWYRMLGYRQQFISDFVYRISDLKSVGGFYKIKLAWASDDISSFIAASYKGIAHTQNPVFCYRKSGITISSSGSATLKLEAIEQERLWFINFLSYGKPSDATSIILHAKIKEYLPLYIVVKKVHTIAHFGFRPRKGLVDCIKWLFSRKKYDLSIENILSAYWKYYKTPC